MKNAKANLFVLGILTALLSGCFNPITAIPPKQEDQAVEPFTVNVLIGKDTVTDRSIAGPDAVRIKEGIHNIMQLVVVNDSDEIVAFDEARRGSEQDQKVEFRIESLPYNNNYHFLLLMGHWERDYEAEQNSGGVYKYKKDTLPTLLAAGLTQKKVTGSGTVTVTMWPIVVDTVFTTSNTKVPAESRTTAPQVIDGKPGTVKLLPGDWEVKWTLKPGTPGNILDTLVQAQKAIPTQVNKTAILLKSKTSTVRMTDLTDDTQPIDDLNGNVITLHLPTEHTSGIKNIGNTGSINFRLEYVPFNKTAAGQANPWTKFQNKSSFNLSGTNTPVWIIRNGINDAAQNDDTDFTNFGKKGKANGNGAVSFVIVDGSGSGSPGSRIPDINMANEGSKVNIDGRIWWVIEKRNKDNQKYALLLSSYDMDYLRNTVDSGDYWQNNIKQAIDEQYRELEASTIKANAVVPDIASSLDTEDFSKPTEKLASQNPDQKTIAFAPSYAEANKCSSVWFGASSMNAPYGFFLRTQADNNRQIYYACGNGTGMAIRPVSLQLPTTTYVYARMALWVRY
jgi:hypothetical protein